MRPGNISVSTRDFLFWDGRCSLRVATTAPLLSRTWVVTVASLSPGGQSIAHFFPCMYYTRLVEGSFLKGTGMAQLWHNVAVLMLFSVVLFAISYMRFHKRTNG